MLVSPFLAKNVLEKKCVVLLLDINLISLTIAKRMPNVLWLLFMKLFVFAINHLWQLCWLYIFTIWRHLCFLQNFMRAQLVPCSFKDKGWNLKCFNSCIIHRPFCCLILNSSYKSVLSHSEQLLPIQCFHPIFCVYCSTYLSIFYTTYSIWSEKSTVGAYLQKSRCIACCFTVKFFISRSRKNILKKNNWKKYGILNI